MTWTTPTDGFPIPSQNERLLYSQLSGVGVGGAYKANTFTHNAAAQEFDGANRVILDVATLDDEGTPQIRLVQTVQITALNGCTSFRPRAQALVEAASGATGTVTTTIDLSVPTALTGGTLTTGFKSFDSGWIALSAIGSLSTSGFVVLKPRFQLDSVTANPTLFHLTSQAFLKVA